MKKLYVLLAFAFIACNKPDLRPLPSTNASLQFKYDGAIKAYGKLEGAVVRGVGPRALSIVATKEPEAANYFNLVIYADSLRPGNYPAKMVLFREGTVSASSDQSVNLVLSITSFQGGKLTGTFVGSLLYIGGIAAVTEGEINNLPLQFK